MIQEKIILISDELKNILVEIESESIVASLLLKETHKQEDLVANPVNYISISSEDRTKISYLTEERINLLTKQSLTNPELWTSSRRFQVKPGSFITKLFKNIHPKDVEKFSNLFRSQSVKPVFHFTIVSGEDIRKLYNYKSYSVDSRGSLGASCMKMDECQKFLDIYVKNEDKVSMLTMMDTDNRVMGRAILWNFDSNKIMDRIYTKSDEELCFYFKQWATKNGYLYKTEQHWTNTLSFEQINVSKQEFKFEIKLNPSIHKFYPYMDTFKFLDINTGSLYNHIPDDSSSIRTLSAADGSRYEQDYFRLDEIDRIYRHRTECIFLEYIKINTWCGYAQWSEVNSQYILSKDCEYDKTIDDYVFIEEYVQLNKQDRIEDVRKMKIEREKERAKEREKEREKERRNSISIGSRLQELMRSQRDTSTIVDTIVDIPQPATEEIESPSPVFMNGNPYIGSGIINTNYRTNFTSNVDEQLPEIG